MFFLAIMLNLSRVLVAERALTLTVLLSLAGLLAGVIGFQAQMSAIVTSRMLTTMILTASITKPITAMIC